MGEVTRIWNHVTDQVYEELDLLATESGAVATALNTIIATAVSPIELTVDGYTPATPESLANQLVVPEGLSHSQTTGGGWGAGLVGPIPPLPGGGGATGAAANEFVPYVSPRPYDWFESGDDKYYTPKYEQAPSFTESEPQFPVYAEPSVGLEDTVVDPPIYLDSPEFVLQQGVTPDVPEFRDIALPDAPSVVIPDFTPTTPDFQHDNLSVGLDFQDSAYTSALLGALQATSGLWLNGQHALTTSLWTALQEAAVARGGYVDRQWQDWARQSWLSKGWPVYEQQLDFRHEEAQQVGQHVRANIFRDANIQKETLLVNSMRAAIQTGVALEQVLISIWDQANQRLLEAATALIEFANAANQLRIKEFEAQTRIYSSKSTVLKAQIAAEEEKLTLSKAQIDAETLRGQIDKDRIDVYEAQQQAQLSRIDEYEAYQQGWMAQEDRNDAINEQFRGLVEAYQQFVAKYISKWRIYQTQIKQRLARPNFENTLIQSFAERIRAATGEIDVEQKKATTKLEQLTEQLDRAQTCLSKQRADIRDALNTLVANSANERTKLQQQSAGFAYTRTYNQAETTKPQLAAMDNSEQTQHLMQRLRFAERKHELATQQGAVAINAASRAYSQLGAASFSAVNVHMSASGSLGDTWNWNTTYVVD